jgi:hypothetical protein
MVHGYGRKARGLKQVFGKGIDDAELITRYKTDPIMGGTGMNVNFVTFLRAADVEAQASAEEAGPDQAEASPETARALSRRDLNGVAAVGAGKEVAS